LIKAPTTPQLFVSALLALLICFHVNAQSVRIISTSDGLPQAFVAGLVQDDSGFVWVGTRNGIARFDGLNFDIFRHNPNDTTSIASNLIIWMRKDRHNKIWIEHESGDVDQLDPLTEKIQHLLKNDPVKGRLAFMRRGWLVDENGVFWCTIRSAGIYRYDARTRQTITYTTANKSLPSDTVLAITDQPGNKIWAMSLSHLSYLNSSTGTFEHYPIPYTQDYGNFDGMDAVTIDLHERSNGELMWADRSHVYFFNPGNKQFRNLQLPYTAYLGARWIRTGSDGAEYFENYGHIYRYTDKKGIEVLPDNPAYMRADPKSFLADRSGMLWLGSNGQGIVQVDLQQNFFTAYNSRKDFAKDMLQTLFSTDLQKTFGYTLSDSIFSQAGYHLRSGYDQNKRLYIALKRTVAYADSGSKKLVSLPEVSFDMNNKERGIAIKGLSFLPDGSPLVMGYTGQAMAYRFATQRWEEVLNASVIHSKYDKDLLPQDIYCEGQRLWITTSRDGLLSIDLTTKNIRQITAGTQPGMLPTNQLIGIVADPVDKNKLWLGSYEGLISFDKQTQKCAIYSMQDGLPDNMVYSMIPDMAGNLWVSCNQGLYRFNLRTHEVRSFQTRHGLPENEFNRFHHLKLPDGQFVFGATSAWVMFDPARIKEDRFQTPLGFTGIKVNNLPLKTEAKSALYQPLNAIEELRLPFDQNTVSISFAGLEYNQPVDIRYRYKLEGYDKTWVNAGNSGQAIYTRIPPGPYTLLVNASNTSGDWSTRIKQLKIRIGAPWWATKFAYLCYLIIAGGLLWTFLRFRVTQLLMKKEVEMRETEAVRLKELDNMKTRFFSNITHELRTPLTLISGPAEQLKAQKNLTDQQSRLLDTISSNARQLLGLMNRLLDLSKLEAGAMKLHEYRGQPGKIVGTIVDSFEVQATDKKIMLMWMDDTSAADGLFHRDALERVVYNLLSNAMKFTPSGGSVHITLGLKEDQLILKVKDTGVGISEEDRKKIFERYFQVAARQKNAEGVSQVGTGIGLSMVKELVQQLKGTITVEDNPDAASGTLFTVSLPFITATEQPVTTPIPEAMAEDNEVAEGQNQQRRVLIVEDNDELAGFISGILLPEYQVFRAANGAEGLNVALEQMPDLVISDVMMPVMDGFAFCTKLKEDIRLAHIPVIMLTAKVEQEDIETGLRKGADEYLTKPFHPAELSLRIRNQLTRQERLRRQLQQELQPSKKIEEEVPAPVHVPEDIFLTRLYALLEEHLDDALFGVDQLAAAMNISRSSLHRKLKVLTDMSTTEVVRNYRLKKAVEFLKQGFNSSETAYKSGFGSPAYFTRCFREVYGVPPGEFLRQVT